MQRRRHHCRGCGDIFCDVPCTQWRMQVPHLGEKPQRVCRKCYLDLSGDPDLDRNPSSYTSFPSSNRRLSGGTLADKLLPSTRNSRTNTKEGWPAATAPVAKSSPRSPVKRSLAHPPRKTNSTRSISGNGSPNGSSNSLQGLGSNGGSLPHGEGGEGGSGFNGIDGTNTVLGPSGGGLLSPPPPPPKPMGAHDF
mmetsp:Transcript_5631/g.12964  ORF Transcript_5631/g.12964 Transcript_5631/m.12964 type:complete len:194 (+) Transcript_5631:1366-1947(+)